MKMNDYLKQYVEFTIKSIVDFPNDVKIEVVCTTKNILIQVDTNKADYGKVIGKNGRSIGAIKTLCSAIKNTKFSDDSRYVMVELLEDDSSDFYNKK